MGPLQQDIGEWHADDKPKQSPQQLIIHSLQILLTSASSPLTAQGAMFSVACLFIGAIAAHLLTKRRDIEREADVRRRQFRKFARVWRYTIERLPNNAPAVVWAAYEKIAVEIMAEGCLVEGDFRRKAELIEAINAAGLVRRKNAEAEAQSKGASLREVLQAKVKAIQEIADQG